MSIAPRQLIALAEETGLIISLGSWVIDAACSQLARWRSLDSPASFKDEVFSALTVAINIAPAQLLSNDFVNGLRQTLARYQLPATAL